MKLILQMTLLLAACVAVGCQEASTQPVEQGAGRQDREPASGKQETDDSGNWDRLTQLYEDAKSSGETRAANVREWIGEVYDSARSSGESAATESSEWVNRLYQQAKEAGETSADNAKDWVMGDIQQIGRWNYKTMEVPQADLSSAVNELNKLGAQRWECFWVDRQPESTTFYLKRSGRSYLRLLPSKDLIKLLPMLGGEGAPN